MIISRKVRLNGSDVFSEAFVWILQRNNQYKRAAMTLVNEAVCTKRASNHRNSHLGHGKHSRQIPTSMEIQATKDYQGGKMIALLLVWQRNPDLPIFVQDSSGSELWKLTSQLQPILLFERNSQEPSNDKFYSTGTNILFPRLSKFCIWAKVSLWGAGSKELELMTEFSMNRCCIDQKRECKNAAYHSIALQKLLSEQAPHFTQLNFFFIHYFPN